MKEIEERTLQEIISTGTKEEQDYYYNYVASLKTNAFYKEIVESCEGQSIEDITYSIMEREQEYESTIFFPGDITFFYPRIREQRAQKQITCDFSAGIIKPGSLYVNYRPMIYNMTTQEAFVLKRTIKVESAYIYNLPSSTKELEALDMRLKIEDYDDNSGILYSHLSQCLGGEIILQKLKRRK